MNNPNPSSSPRIVCRVVRWKHTELEAQATWASRHVADCADCTAHYAKHQSLAHELQASAPRNLETIQDGLEDRIWAAVQSDQAALNTSPQSRPVWANWRAGAALASFALVAALLVWSQGSIQSTETNIARVDFDENDMRQLVTQIGDLSAEWLVAAETDVDAETAGPLSEELNALEADASAALQFLQRSFLPTPESAS